MDIEWISYGNNNQAVTIYNNNITLSKKAANYFNDAYGVAVGVDVKNKSIIIKKIIKEDINNNIFKKEDIYNLTMKPSFGRINSKKLISELSKYIKLDFFSQVSYKFSAIYNTGNKMLIVDTKEVFVND